MVKPKTFALPAVLVGETVGTGTRRASQRTIHTDDLPLGDRYDTACAYYVTIARLTDSISNYLNKLREIRDHVRRTGEGVYLLPYVESVIAQLEAAFCGRDREQEDRGWPETNQ